MAEQQVGQFNPGGLANTAWASATLGQSVSQLFAAMAKAAEQQVDLQAIANTAWELAMQLYAALAKAAEQQVGMFNPQNLANMAWARA